MVETERTLKVVWLDLDDTIVDFHANSDAALRRVYDEWGLSRYYNNDVERWLDSYHRHNAELWRLYDAGSISQGFLRTERFRRPLAETAMPAADIEMASRELDPAYLDYLAMESRTMPGAPELLRWLKEQGYIVGVLSNGFNGVQQRKLVSAGVDSLIDLVVLSDEIGVNKPDARLYRYAMERSGVPEPSSHLMIGDNPDTDIAGALAAGWGAILYSPRGLRGYALCPEIASLDLSKPLISG